MEHFSTHPDVFFKLYEDALEKTRLLCMDKMTKRQITELKLANKFKFKSEIKKAKMINPKVFSVSEFSEDDFYNISFEATSASDKDYIRKVKHLTKQKLDEWIEYHSQSDRYGITTLYYIKYSTAYFLLKTKMLSDEQVAIVILSDMKYITTNKSLVKVAEEFGYKLSDEIVALYYLRNTPYCKFDFLDENGQELRDRAFTSVIKIIKENEIKYNEFVYYFREMMRAEKNNKKEWEAIFDLFNNYPSYDDLFKASWKSEKVISSVTNHINNGDFDIKFLDNLGFNIFPKSQRLFLGV